MQHGEMIEAPSRK